MAEKNRKKIKRILILIVLILVIVLLIKIIQGVFSRYTSEAESERTVDIAFFLSKAEQKSQNIVLEDLLPRTEPYIYSFEVRNYENSKKSEVNLEYKISVKSTTNLPLNFKLYKNETYSASASDCFLEVQSGKNYSLTKDSYNTYFKELSTDMNNKLEHASNSKDTYYLAVFFTDKNYLYEDIIDSIEITVDAQEVI